MKRLSILGSTGSIGTQTLDVVDRNPERYQVVALGARRSWETLRDQALRYRPRLVALLEEDGLDNLRQALPKEIEVVGGMSGMEDAAALPEATLVVSSLVGMAGLQPTLKALQAGKDIALANKETLVVGGELVMGEARKRGLKILPVDSEHSAIFQCLQNQKGLHRIILTASGGPFRKRPAQELPQLTAELALQHPTWNMGAKITVDSASLMNKGFEVLEAQHLFELSLDQVEVWVHPQSIIHSLVEFVDGSVLAQLGPPDMRTPISYALTYPERFPPMWSRLTLEYMRELTFEAPRWDDFPCLSLAFQAGRTGGTAPCVLNAANEVAVQLFLENRIRFGELYRIIDATMQAHEVKQSPDLGLLLETDRWAREYASGVRAAV